MSRKKNRLSWVEHENKFTRAMDIAWVIMSEMDVMKIKTALSLPQREWGGQQKDFRQKNK